ncbi:MAG: hypothetical protein WA151_04830 [Desulfatirhabdiaceae bacterium]
MLNKRSWLVTGFFILVFPLIAHGFNCNKPDFGARIEDLNKDGYFVKYMENGGISYYNYTGPCRMEMHEHVSSTISYAFVENQLYARIVYVPGQNASPSDVRQRLEKQVSNQIGRPPYSMKQEGDWWVYQWFNEKDNLKFKIKVHSKTNEGKGAFYYEPLRAKLKTGNESNDPASLMD